MTFFDWLASPAGLDLVHALIVALLALSGWFTYKAKQRADDNSRLLNGHLVEHVALAAQLEGSPPHPAPAGAETEARPVAPPSQREL